MAFWGSVVKPGKSPGAVYVPELKGGEGTPPDLLHLSQASLLATGKRASLLLKHKGEGATPICICTLTDSLPSQSLDLFIDAYTVRGRAMAGQLGWPRHGCGCTSMQPG